MAILMEELEMKVKNEALDSFVLRAFDPGPLQTCKLCSIEFSLIAIHKKVFHSDNKEIRCAFCAMLFVSRKDLLDHLDEHRDGSDQFCCYCLIGQSSDDALTEHVETHRELHIFLCYKCRRTFATKSGLSGHDCVPDLAISYTKLEVSENSSAVVGEGDVESVRRVVKIEQRQVRLSESTFSENRAPRVLKSPGVPTQYSNRIIKLGEHRSTFSVTTTSNTNSIGSNGAVISLKTQSREDTNNCAVIDVKTGISPEKGDFFQDQNSIVEVTRTDESRRSPSVAVEFQEHQDPVIDGRSEVDRIGGSDSVTVKFESDSPIDIVLCSNHEAVMNENEDPLAVALAEEYRSTAGGVSHGGSAATSADTSTSSQGEFGCNDGSSFSTSMKVEAMDSCADTLSLSPGTTDKKFHSKANAGLPGTSDITSPVALPTPPSSQGDSGVDAYNLALQPPPVVEDLEKRILETDLPNTSLPSTTSQIENSTGKLVRIVRSRKRLHAATCDSVNEKMATPLEVQTHVEEPVEIRLAEESVAPTPPDSPPPSKKKRITFNETIEYWNPTLQERAWMELAEEFPEVREVPLLKVSSKKSKKKSKKKKKSSKSKKAQKSPVKTKLVLKPVLKPSPVPQVESPAPKPLTEQNVKRRGGSIPAHSDQLYKKFGHGFRYLII
ncbi:hypothetical protein GE061_014626 [Apolygus lucorum]|uniref:C2H2-type domain-containing protein n=1 Tax=Apolygus lucorum TaxID=248454 RepID=A0A8S9XJZ0_APOLU|nr:hypothetical protein GE061_014626 [Apolygus lucorum]